MMARDKIQLAHDVVKASLCQEMIDQALAIFNAPQMPNPLNMPECPNIEDTDDGESICRKCGTRTLKVFRSQLHDSCPDYEVFNTPVGPIPMRKPVPSPPQSESETHKPQKL